MNLSEYSVKNVPSVDIERGYSSKSGAVGAGVVFLWWLNEISRIGEV